MSNIIIPKQRVVIEAKAMIGMKGFVRVQTRNKDTLKVRIDTGFFPNQLLDTGRNIMATEANWMNWCHVGTDNTAPNAGQSALVGFTLATNNIQSDVSGASGVAPYYGWRRKVFRFPAGPPMGNENLKEVGVGWAATNDGKLISRALILDPILQTPTTITPLPDEVLDITYELRYYAPVADVDGPQVVLNGITYDTTTRAASVSGGFWYQWIGTQISARNFNPDYWIATDGVIGTVLQGPGGNGSSGSGVSVTNSGYSGNSYELEVNASVPSPSYNLGAGIRSMSVLTSAGAFQTQFDANPGGATIPKTNEYTMTMHWTIGWTVLP